MKTSYQQYAIMVDFMEKHGDLSKPGMWGRHYYQYKWKELTKKLNKEASGESRPQEKWRKVWSDFKNNCKKKWEKINRAAPGTSCGPALQLSVNDDDLENRVIQIIGLQAPTGLEVTEAGFLQDVKKEKKAHEHFATNDPLEGPKELVEIKEIGWQTAATSIHSTVVSPSSPPTLNGLKREPSPPGEREELWTPPPKKSKNNNVDSGTNSECERDSSECLSEWDRMHERLETERLRQQAEELRLREWEIRERVRQRDRELELQSRWQELMGEFLNIIERHFGRHDKSD